jgi:hypothetical protein
MENATSGISLKLGKRELKEVQRRGAIRAHVLHEAIGKEGEGELTRPAGALAWSALAAGLSMGIYGGGGRAAGRWCWWRTWLGAARLAVIR